MVRALLRSRWTYRYTYPDFLNVERKLVYFIADAHLGLKQGDPAEREARLVKFLKELPRDAKALYLLGDMWDFWYEYRDVVPKEGARVVAELIQLMDAGVEVFFFEGNHDMWTYSFFESLGMKKLAQPSFVEIGGKTFCLGHGDGLGGAKWSYRLMLKIFHCRFCQVLFSTIHPWLAYRFGLSWSDSNRRTHAPYTFRGAEEPLYKFASDVLLERHVDYFVFGHFHCFADIPVEAPDGGSDAAARLLVVRDWIRGSQPYALFDGEKLVNFE